MMETTLSDPARFADAIRALARDAHRLRDSQSPTAHLMLSRRIETLTSVLGDRRGSPLGSWLDNLGRELQTAAVHAAMSPRRMCICA
jgi:hypothetical protein